LIVFLRNRLKYALTYDEVKKILKQRLIKVDGKVRTDVTYPAGFMGKRFVCTIHSSSTINSIPGVSLMSQGFHGLAVRMTLPAFLVPFQHLTERFIL